MLIVGHITGDLKALLNEQLNEVADAARAATRAAAEDLQAELRAQVRAAGLGVGLEKAWRLDVYPRAGRKSLRPAGLVWSKAERLHDAFDGGDTVTARGGKWLAIPLDAAKAAGLDKSRERRIPGRQGKTGRGGQMAKWSNVAAAEGRFGRLRFVPLDGNKRALLVADGKPGAPAVPLFLLVSKARGRKLLDIGAAAKKAEARLATNLSNMIGR
ncbi:DUF6441 family protein [Azospirillum canadense]|uniref:DUF6441 family protein n=1 Tax=Azospirillum canadense TaxID=403962 RepID=UPI0022265AF6|nr:DUF6441 family protein [Azospirillum canadense]MCW2242807.1 hypothetical protein [Azospirillum canadense]